MADLGLSAEEILKQEFEYARETATQAQNDRTTVVGLYLFLAGGVSSLVIAGLPSAAPRSLEFPSVALAILFGLLGVVGLFTLMKLVRLRQAWYDSATAMTKIKEFYLVRFPDLKDAFHWNADSLPPPGKPWTITFNLALLVMLLDSAVMGVAAHLTGFRVPFGEYAVDAFVAVIFFAWQVFYYFFQLPAG
jgi:hypothetical protein